MAAQALFDGILGYVWWEYNSFGWVNVIDPLVIYVWVSELGESVNVVVGLTLVECQVEDA